MVAQTYLPNKTVTLEDGNTGTSSNSINVSSINNYPAHKTAIVLASDNPTVYSTNNYPSHKTEAIAEQLTDLDAATTIHSKQRSSFSEYPLHKTVSISDTEITEGRTEKTALPEIKPKPIAVKSDGLKANYPAHKTYNFNVEENKTTSANVGVTAANENIKSADVTAGIKSGKPILWIAMSVFFFLTSAVTGFLSYKQQTDLQEEVAQLKQNKEELADELKKFQKDIHIDDIIARGVKLAPEGDITVVSSATEAEALRVCFSVSGNLNAKTGVKVVYIRVIGPDNNVLTKTKENMFTYKGNQFPFSFKKEIEFNNQELMVCFDYELEKKLQKGEYKAEIYNDEVMDGMVSFELN